MRIFSNLLVSRARLLCEKGRLLLGYAFTCARAIELAGAMAVAMEADGEIIVHETGPEPLCVDDEQQSQDMRHRLVEKRE